MMKNFIIHIDGIQIETASGRTILEAAQEHNIYIPTLCHHPRTGKTGKCRLCVVEVEGDKNLQPSCCTEATDGMIIRTCTRRVIETRRTIVELYLSSGNHNCLTCESNSKCELQDAAWHLGIEETSFPLIRRNLPIDTSSPMIIRDMNKCIQCYRCIAGCNRIAVNEVLDMGFRGNRMTVICDTDKPMGKSSCVICGECVQLCPTGALTEKKSVGRARAWETKMIRTTCPYCGVGCQMHLHIKGNEIIKVTGTENVSPNKGSLCIKGRFGYDFVHSSDRLSMPLIRKGNDFVEVSWDDALDYTARKLTGISHKHGPDSIVGIGCARSTNESNYLMMKFMRAVIGTNNIDHCART